MMNLQSLAVIFIIIVLPISLVLQVYTQSQIDTLNLQISYDSKLKDSTYDAIKAFQLNTINSSTSDLANSKMRDLEASVNAFFTSVATNFNVQGYNASTLQDYVPALVYTLYDGYYIYSPYTNTLKNNESNDNSTYKDEEKLYGLKPYIYYSCEYTRGNDNFVITYSLDNYITIQGYISGNWVNDAGYLISGITYDDSTITYRKCNINKNQSLMEEYVGQKLYSYLKINGVKYYYDKDNGKWFYLLNGKQVYTNIDLSSGNDSSAYYYYKEAADFTKRVFNDYNLGELKASNAKDASYKNTYGDTAIFDKENIEEPNSKFNEHRLAVIRNSIESNLSTAIANFNNYSTTTTDFRMPKLKEDEWDKILNNVSLISFMQGLSIGGKIYNGYSIVTNNTNEEVVTEDSIYIVTNNYTDSNSTYCNVRKKDLNKDINQNSVGIFYNDLQRKSLISDTGTDYYFPKKSLADYESVVMKDSLDYENDGNIYEYLSDKENLATVYYTALGRERYSMYKVNRNVQDLLKNYQN